MKSVLGSLLLVGLTSALLSTLISPAAAQKKPVAATKLAALKVTGTTVYSYQEILAASGLVIGQIAADGDFKEAVQRLGDSGMFSDVAYSYSASPSGMCVEIRLADVDASKLVPAQFDNFVWFNNKELRAELQRRVPLFREMVPLEGTLSAHIGEALQSMLTDKQLPGRVDFMREAQGQNGGPLTAISYRVEDVGIFIHGFEFPGASPEQAALLATAARRAVGGAYSRTGLATVAKLDLLPVYLQRGYLKAEFAPCEARVVARSVPENVPQAEPSANDTGNAPEVLVDAILGVTTGKVYLVSGVDWKDNSAIPAAELAPMLHLLVGQPADAIHLLNDVKAVRKLYRSRGYMTAQIKTEAQLNDELSTVHYEMAVVEGDLYKMGELEITGLNAQTTARMRAAWTLREGQPYNADYPAKFGGDTTNILPRSEQWAITVHETPDAKDKTVDVEIRFKRE